MNKEINKEILKYLDSPLFKSITIEIGFKKITYKLCKFCKKKIVNVLDISLGKQTIISDNICLDCGIKHNKIPHMLFLPL